MGPNKESDFRFDELFFSRTNRKGIIHSGNSVFQRVSKYDWTEILNKPHNVIRHPSMPKGVFHLFWEYLLANKLTGAYVVNKSKDHSYYWVYAIVFPIEDGFVSVRIKPSSPIFDEVKEQYAQLLKMEKQQNLSPEASNKLLLKNIKKLGFENYDHFMIESLTKEMEFRQTKLGKEPITSISKLRNILKLGEELQQKCETIVSEYKKIAYVPLNLDVEATRIGSSASTISVVSSQYSAISQQIQAETQKFLSSGNIGQAIKDNVRGCQFDVCNLILIKELVEFFKVESKDTPINKDEELKFLEELRMQGIDRVQKSLTAVEEIFAQFGKIFEEMHKLTMTLDILGITGKIEAVKVDKHSEFILALLNDLINFKTSLKQLLKEIDDIGKELILQNEEMKTELKTYY